MDIFRGMFQHFWESLFSMSNDCFDKAARYQPSRCNRKKTAAALKLMVKSHEALKEPKSLAKSCSSEKLF